MAFADETLLMKRRRPLRRFASGSADALFGLMPHSPLLPLLLAQCRAAN
jgi:hypothetical protein